VTTPESEINNIAEDGAVVGIQGQEVHNSTVYMVLPGDSPREKYEVGLRFLDDGVPARARELIGEAIAHKHDNDEVRFHLVLAMFSKRAYRDLNLDERNSLARTSELLRDYADSEWKRALQAVFELLECLEGHGEAGLALQKLNDLRPEQREKIIRHLDLVLTGGMKDSLWAETRLSAKDDRYGAGRLDRVWAYFHAKPIGPRVRQPAHDSSTSRDRVQAVLSSCMFVVAVGYLGWLVLVHAKLLPILAYVIAAAAMCVGARTGLDWRYRTQRLTDKERAYFGQRGIDRAPEGGFASRVDDSFGYYFAKYVPAGAVRDVWVANTTGIRNTLRDEVVELYRESRISVDRVTWLIRHMVSGVRRDWEAGTLWDYRERYRTEPSTKLWCAVSLATMVPAAVVAVTATMSAAAVPTAIATIAVLISGRVTVTRWLHIISERRRLGEERLEYQRLVDERDAAYHRWKAKLEAQRPSESEMETWLTCDKTMLLDDALRHYQLAWRDIIAHAFLQTPAKRYRRARIQGGPWRYSRYDIRLFLITQDGVREVSTELNFETVTLNGQERYNFRFDAVSSVHVATTDRVGYTMRLTLINGPTRDIRVVDPALPEAEPDERTNTFSELNLDAAGFAHTLHILEGIAAEGKGWINAL
jgi:hypothetical protein